MAGLLLMSTVDLAHAGEEQRAEPDQPLSAPVPSGPVSGWSQETQRNLMALRWDGTGAPEGCLSEKALAERVEAYLGLQAFDETAPRVLSVTLESVADARLRARVTVADEQGRVVGEREILTDDGTCEALEEPLVLAVALLVDANLGVEPARSAAAAFLPPEPEEEEPADEEPAPPVEVAPPAPPDPWRVELDASAAAADGLLPEFGFGAELGLLADPPWFLPLRARVSGWLPQREDLGARGGLDVAAALGGLMICPLSERQPALGIDACVGADLVAQRAESHGVEGARTSTQWFAQGTLTVRAQAELSGAWFSILSAGLGAPLGPPEYFIHKDGERTSVFQTAGGVMLLSLGLGFRVTD